MRASTTPVPNYHHHTRHQDNTSSADPKKIVLAGNPNVGKSVFFNYLSGLYVDVSNYPGTTVDVCQGRFGNHTIWDTPGIYGVSSFNDEERVARDVILDADVILNVVDAVHLERDLFLTLQLIDMGFPMVIALNFMDEVNKEGVQLNVPLLEDLLGVKVIPTSAINKTGLEDVAAALDKAQPGRANDTLHSQLHDLLRMVGSQPEAMMIYEGDEAIAIRHGVHPLPNRESSYISRRQRVNEIIEKATKSDESTTLRLWLGKMALHPVVGFPLIVGVLFLLYQIVGVWIAQDVVGFTEVELGNKVYERTIKDVVAGYSSVTIVSDIVTTDEQGEEKISETRSFDFPEGTRSQPARLSELETFEKGRDVVRTFDFHGPISTMLAGEFGILTMTITYLLFLLLPLVVGFYTFLAILEDCGYLPRLATLVDRLMTGIGLNGRAVIPILLGFGCVTMATITTRLLSTSREKTIAAAILNFVIPCSAQLAVITALLASAGGLYTLSYVVIMFVILAVVGTILNASLPGKSSALLIDLPPMRWPKFDNVARKTFIKSYGFMKEATPWFFFGATIVSFMQVTGLLQMWQDLFAPLTTKWLLLPREAATAFVMGMVRRDFGAAGFLTMSLTSPQILVGLVTLTLFVPCVASVVVLMKERGWKEGAVIWIGTWIGAFTIGGIVAQILALII